MWSQPMSWSLTNPGRALTEEYNTQDFRPGIHPGLTGSGADHQDCCQGLGMAHSCHPQGWTAMGRAGILHSTASGYARGTQGTAPESRGYRFKQVPTSLLEMSRNEGQEQVPSWTTQQLLANLQRELPSVDTGLPLKRIYKGLETFWQHFFFTWEPLVGMNR